MEIASFQDFWTLVVDVWKNGLFGIPLSNGLIALGIFTLFMLFRNLMTRFVLATIKRAATRTKTDIDDRVVEAITDPIRFILW
ncbi:hypothetical protein JCM17843_06100 [Kordiimonadales bacterium JCM 17843]|nr:hypothetical protein JCM17843_06100 [Kordiimonadales bacterium JCM 17843]